MATQNQNGAGRAPAGRAPANRPAPQRRKRRKKNSNAYLYIALLLCVIGLALFGLLIYFIADNTDDGPDQSMTSEVSEGDNISSQNPNESSAVTSESSDSPDESSQPQSSEPDTSDPPAPVIPVSTKEYEAYIGVDYAIDMSEYEEYVCPDNEADFVYIVNPDHPLSSDYVPPNLVWCTNIRSGRPKQWSYIDATANKALEAFLKEAAYYGFDDITVTNAYRSYSSQASLFSGYVASDLQEDYYCDTCGEYIDYSYERSKISNGACAVCGTALRRPTEAETTAHVLTYSTRPGTSEHQSGLCCDMHNLPSTTSAFDDTPEAKWLAENAHRFGFILRYPEGTQHITGIKHESWHFRYVGRTAATEMYEKGLTLEEYLGDYVE